MQEPGHIARYDYMDCSDKALFCVHAISVSGFSSTVRIWYRETSADEVICNAVDKNTNQDCMIIMGKMPLINAYVIMQVTQIRTLAGICPYLYDKIANLSKSFEWYNTVFNRLCKNSIQTIRTTVTVIYFAPNNAAHHWIPINMLWLLVTSVRHAMLHWIPINMGWLFVAC